MTSLLVLSGPNLNLLGSREPDIYGSETLADIESYCEAKTGAAATWFQSNSEADLINQLHSAVGVFDAVVINPGAFTHYSYALRDAVAATMGMGLVIIEVHLSNPHAREEFRHKSVLSGVVTGTIAGFGKDSYLLAMKQLLAK